MQVLVKNIALRGYRSYDRDRCTTIIDIGIVLLQIANSSIVNTSGQWLVVHEVPWTESVEEQAWSLGKRRSPDEFILCQPNQTIGVSLIEVLWNNGTTQSLRFDESISLAGRVNVGPIVPSAHSNLVESYNLYAWMIPALTSLLIGAALIESRDATIPCYAARRIATIGWNQPWTCVFPYAYI